jgi:twitching motility protein PilT
VEGTYLGQLAIAYKLLSEDQLEHCLELQERTDPPAYLGEVIVGEGYLSPKALERLLTTQKRRQEEEHTQPHASRKALADRVVGAELSELLSLQVELGASDLFLGANKRPQVRLHGRLSLLAPRPLTIGRCNQLLNQALNETQRAQFEEKRSLVFLHEVPAVGRFRVACFHQRYGPSAVFSHIADTLPDTEWLGLPSIVRQVPRLRKGLVLVTGAAGSGKTTTLATMIAEINRSRRCHVVTLEQPIEYVFNSGTSIISQREIGPHASDFSAGLRAALRADPDVVVVGELTDPERIMTALTAAETGHLVLGTLHTTSAYRTIVRVLDAYSGRRRQLARNMLANLLRLVICQQLIPSREGDRLHLAAEVLVPNAAVANMIREDRIHQIPQVMQTSREEGMVLMDDSLIALARDRRIDVTEAVARAYDRKKILELETKN